MYHYWILKRDDEYKVVSTVGDQNPLYGEGSWNLYAGPFSSIEEAEEKIP